METFQKLKILLPENRNDYFLVRLTAEIQKSKWKVRQDLILNYKKNTLSEDKSILCVESIDLMFANKHVKGLVWLWDYNGFLEVFNIIPINSNSLSFKEYNFILNTFNSAFIVPLATEFNAEIVLSKPEKLVAETIGPKAYKALTSFSNSANKSTGNSHTYDFERWCEFVFIIFREEIELGTNELEVWLVENGWSRETATKLAHDYAYSISLLEKYEHN